VPIQFSKFANICWRTGTEIGVYIGYYLTYEEYDDNDNNSALSQ